MQAFKHLNIIFVLIAGLLILAGGFFVWQNFDSSNKKNIVSIRGQAFEIEKVITQTDKQKGLGERQNLCVDCGMLFVFDNPDKYAFWMKDMQFALDILWLKDGKVVFLEKNILPTFKGTLTPTEDADQVLEINAGKVDELGIEVGDAVW